MSKPFRGALLGRHIGYSLSAEIFGRMYELLDIDGTFEMFDVASEELDSALIRLREFDGFSVTVPYKEAVIAHLDRMDAVATAIGAVNSVSCDSGNLTGYNTDWQGFLHPLQDKIQGGDRITVIGNGGAARAVVWALLTAYPEVLVTIAGRDMEKSNRLAERLVTLDKAYGARMACVAIDGLAAIEAEIAVNCTPVGSSCSPEISPVPESCDISGVRIAYDLGYVPEETGFLRHMSESGCEAINGLPMLVHQAAASLAVWRKQKLDIEEIARVVLTDVSGVNRC
ncbi:MAG: shikimate dehydrogenase [Candidatus Zixiibacteriota bacterium]